MRHDGLQTWCVIVVYYVEDLSWIVAKDQIQSSMHADVSCTRALQAKAVKAREKTVVDAAKDDDEEVQRKREERDAAKRKEEKVRPTLHQPET